MERNGETVYFVLSSLISIYNLLGGMRNEKDLILSIFFDLLNKNGYSNLYIYHILYVNCDEVDFLYRLRKKVVAALCFLNRERSDIRRELSSI
jgi:hypothetical protein